jgi:hypothetical protein
MESEYPVDAHADLTVISSESESKLSRNICGEMRSKGIRKDWTGISHFYRRQRYWNRPML